ncbi:MAG TPA: hypothetical protein VG755_22530 [Nannocystaceae bacterium]|nr:hypothetical protein [Nannocystaceae bacterium]
MSDEGPDGAALILLLCEYASIHADGTLTIVRGGWQHWTVASVPASLECALVLVIPPNSLAAGEHDVRFRLTTASGATTWTTAMTATVKDARFAIHGTLALSAVIDTFGTTVVEVACGDAKGRVILNVLKGGG